MHVHCQSGSVSVWRLRSVWLLQMRYAAGTKDVLDRFFHNKPLKKDDIIVEVSPLFLPAPVLVHFRLSGVVTALQV